ncbi:MAG: hypothetical protein JNL66_22515 [Alphaproteobacteria bacterium]|nr:hypothetical protein [Alphaproteobacteria bacterium]
MTTIASVVAAGLFAASMLVATAPDGVEVGAPAALRAAACTEALRLVGPACPAVAPPCGTVERQALRPDAFAGAPRRVCLVFFDEPEGPQG